MPESDELSERIRAFLEKYAQIRPDYDPEFDDPEDRWTGPDSSLLEYVADSLAAGNVPGGVIVSWESGCFAPYSSEEGRKELDEILAAVSDLQSSPRPMV
jgi:hypothetical protein